jgi:predicted N-acetyltransferase YhbS
MLLGPVAVHPTRQGEGIGALLIQSGLDRAAVDGVERVLLVGDAPYYARFGFERLDGVEMPPPTNPDRVLGIWDWKGVQGPVERALPTGGEPPISAP